jgi:hypothetical protein
VRLCFGAFLFFLIFTYKYPLNNRKSRASRIHDNNHHKHHIYMTITITASWYRYIHKFDIHNPTSASTSPQSSSKVHKVHRQVHKVYRQVHRSSRSISKSETNPHSSEKAHCRGSLPPTVNLYRSCVGLGWLAPETMGFRLVRASEE